MASYKPYRTDEVEHERQAVSFRAHYPEFIPYHLSEAQKHRLGLVYDLLLESQNGPDFDGYSVGDNNKVERYLKDVPVGSNVLILGVGTGGEILAAQGIGLDCTGVTFGSRNRAYATDIFGIHKDKIIECACELLPFQKEMFDVVAGFQILEHAMSPVIFLMEQARVLKPGGKAIFEWPPAKKYGSGPEMHHQTCLTPGQARSMMGKAGFINIKLYYDDFEPIPETDMWKADLDKMMVIEGQKPFVVENDYLRKIYNT